jgi:cytochrome c biogenesis protein ResB
MADTQGTSRFWTAIGSLRLAIALLVLLAAVCAGATFYESARGTPAVQAAVYRTGWFAALLTLLGLNVATSLILRFRRQLHQTGFVLAHIGVLLLLAGSLVSLQFGLDAQLALYEGESASAMEGEERQPVPLPFGVTLLEFRSERYPGSTMAATYESLVRVEDPEAGTFERRISMNNPLHHRGYVFFQASFVEGRPMMSIFSVARAPGLPIVYLGTTLLCLGVFWMFYVNPAIARHRAARALKDKQRGEIPCAVPAR